MLVFGDINGNWKVLLCSSPLFMMWKINICCRVSLNFGSW